MAGNTRLLRLVMAGSIFALVSFACQGLSFGGVSQEEAAELAVDAVFGDKVPVNPVIMFQYTEMLTSGVVLSGYRPEGFDTAGLSEEINEDTWFFWVDDFPGARFAHPNRFVFVTATDGEVTVLEEEWWPVLNGSSLWVEEEVYWDRGNWAFSSFAEDSSGVNPEIGPKPLRAPALLPTEQVSEVDFTAQAPEKSGKALIVNGWRPGETGKESFAADSRGMYNALSQNGGFDTWYYGTELDGVRKPSGEPTYDDLREWFHKMAEDMQPGETLFVYVTSHGGVDDTGNGHLGEITETMMQTWLDGFDDGVNIIFVGDGCYSGSFLDGLSNVADVAVAATGDKDPSYSDVDLDFVQFGWAADPNPDDEGSEFSSGLVMGLNQVLTDPEASQLLEEEVANAGGNFWNRLIGKAFVTALENDVAYLSGKTFPAIVRKPQEKSPVRSVGMTETREHGYTWSDEIGDGIICQTGMPLSGETPAEIDFGSVDVEWLDSNYLGVTFEFPRVEVIEDPIIGSIELDNLAVPNSNPSDTWYFSGRGEVDGNFYFVPPEPIYTKVFSFYQGSGWVEDSSLTIDIEVEGNKIFMVIPVDSFPYLATPGEDELRLWAGVTTPDTTQCDSIMLGVDGQAEGLIPAKPEE